MMHITQKIKEARTSKGWSQQQIAEKLQEKRSSYAEWETSTIPRADILAKIAEITDKPIAWFFGLADENSAKTKDEKAAKNDNKKDAPGFSNGINERLISEIEARRNDFKAWAERAERDKERLYSIIEKYLSDIAANSTNTRDAVADIQKEIQAEHGVMMDSFDLLLKQPVGTTSSKAGTVEMAIHQHGQKEKNRKVASRK
jgi:transcriptional regulator with XRE-family HTH domain